MGVSAVSPRTSAREGFFYVLEDAVRILFADDDPIMREFAAVQLATDQARVKTAGDGAEALRLVESEPFDILLLDLEMPVMDGFSALERLRADPRTAAMPVIVVTGREDVVAIDKAFQAGATAFVVKPINWRLLSYQIRYVMRAHQAERDSDETLRRMAQDSAALLQTAVRDGSPELKRLAVDYGRNLDEALNAQAQTPSA